MNARDMDALHGGPRGRDLRALWAAVTAAKAPPQVPADVMARIDAATPFPDRSGWDKQ